uniref:Oligopeptide transporter 3-like n=1 Tax=Rhizophora mucronata TaxID=61149 RepID=A0A2P2NHS8_RHIMU
MGLLGMASQHHSSTDWIRLQGARDWCLYP